MHLFYLTIGTSPEIYYQSGFSIITFLRSRSEITSIAVLTDHPRYYRHFGDEIVVHPLQAETIAGWRGKYDFFWRIKIKALEFVADKYPGQPIVYLDSDTFLLGELSRFKELLNNGIAFMHTMEGTLRELGTKTEKRMHRQTKGRTFGGCRMLESHRMWNAGVVGLPGNNSMEPIVTALNICDDMCKANVTRRLIEQFALSVALQETYEVNQADAFIAHYWGNKEEWNRQIAHFFQESHLMNSSLADEVEALDRFQFSQLPLHRKRSSARRKMIKLIERLYPDRAW